ncbi:hypothetical protein TNCV_4622251 [Trichonephila clavipes]|nr:hypothetical protein TNCV_4622251 [Trichonephila clavipes]
MPFLGIEPRPYGAAANLANHSTGWATTDAFTCPGLEPSTRQLRLRVRDHVCEVAHIRRTEHVTYGSEA